jgi:PAS domain S-box-containing protein
MTIAAREQETVDESPAGEAARLRAELAAARQQIAGLMAQAEQQSHSADAAMRRSEEALREARGLSSPLMESSRDCIVVLDLEGHNLFISPGGAQSMDVTDIDAVLGLSWLRVWAGDDRIAAEAALAAARAGGTGRFQGFCPTHSGTPKWWDVVISPLLDAAGRPERLVSVGRDITDFKQAEMRRAAQIELGDRLRDLDDPAAMAFAAAEIMGRTLGVSRAGYGTIDPTNETIAIEPDWNAPGVSSIAGTLRFRDFGSYIDDLNRGMAAIVSDAFTDPRTTASAGLLNEFGARSFINLPIFEHGVFVALFFVNHAAARRWTPEEVAFVRDGADRTRAAIERRRTELRLRDLACSLEQQVAERTLDRNRLWQLSTDVILVAQFDGAITAANPAWLTVLGWPETDLIGSNVLDLIHPDDLSQTQASLATLAQGAPLARLDTRMRHKDGTYRWIAWASVSGGGLINAVGRDFTAEKEQAEALQQAEERLRQSQKMEAVGQLTGGIAHDFNNLLTGISGSLQLMQSRIAQGRLSEIDRYVEAAQSAAKRAAVLTHRLLAFSRQQTLDPKPIILNRLVSGMEELVRRTVGPAVTVEVVAAVGLWMTLVDPNQLENALLNLCINARDAMPGGGKLTIETGNRWLDEREAKLRDVPPGQYVSLCVSDNGTGMAPDVIRRAFDPFFTTKPMGTGTGLGLSMIYGFVRQSGGLARIYSELGQGTMVCLYLPRHFGEAAAEDAAACTSPLPRAGQDETVLVVDDEPTIRMLVVAILEDLGYTALEAENGPAALRMMQSMGRLDLLVTDVGLPGGMNGREVAQAARLLRPGLKVLFITGYAENAVLSHGHLDPGMHVLTKPFEVAILAARIKALIVGQ